MIGREELPGRPESGADQEARLIESGPGTRYI